MSLPVDARPNTPGAQGTPIVPAEKQVDPPNSLIVRAVATIFEWTSFCTYVPGKVHLASDGKTVVYTELEKVDCHGADRGCPNYPSRDNRQPDKPDQLPQKADS